MICPSLRRLQVPNPLNDLSRLESWHSGPSLGLVHPESNQSNIKNAAGALRVQTDFDSSNGGNNRATNAISSPRIKCSHQSQENRLRNRHYKKPTHLTKKVLKPEMLELGEIDISPSNYLSLSKLLLVPLIILHRVEQGGVKSRLSRSLRLKRLNWALEI